MQSLECVLYTRIECVLYTRIECVLYTRIECEDLVLSAEFSLAIECVLYRMCSL